MLEHMVRSGSSRPVWYIHGAENGRVHAMGAHVRELVAQACNVTVYTFYNVPDPCKLPSESGRDHAIRPAMASSSAKRARAAYADTVGAHCGLSSQPVTM